MKYKKRRKRRKVNPILSFILRIIPKPILGIIAGCIEIFNNKILPNLKKAARDFHRFWFDSVVVGFHILKEEIYEWWIRVVKPILKKYYKEFKIIAEFYYEKFKKIAKIFLNRFWKWFKAWALHIFVATVINGQASLVLNFYVFLKFWEDKYSYIFHDFLKYLKNYLIQNLHPVRLFNNLKKSILSKKSLYKTWIKKIDFVSFDNDIFNLPNIFFVNKAPKKSFIFRFLNFIFEYFFLKEDTSRTSRYYFGDENIINNFKSRINNNIFLYIYRDIRNFLYWLKDCIEMRSHTVEFDDSEILFLNDKNWEAEENTEKRHDRNIWNIFYHTKNLLSLFNASRHKELGEEIYGEFNDVGCSNKDLENVCIYSVRHELSSIKKLLDGLIFPIFPISAAIPNFLVHESFSRINKLLDKYKIIPNIGFSPKLTDLFMLPKESVNFQDSHIHTWNITTLIKKMWSDKRFLNKYLLYSGKSHCPYPSQPFNNFYERKYWTVNILSYFWLKIECYIAKFYELDAFSISGECFRFENNLLEEPELCHSYFDSISKKIIKEYENNLQEYFKSEESLYPKLPFELDFLDLDCHNNLYLRPQENEEKSNL